MTFEGIFLCENAKDIIRVYNSEAVSRLPISEHIYTKDEVLKSPELFKETKYIFSTWGMPKFTEEEIKSVFPSLEAIFYGAGTVQGFAREFLNCGVRIFSAWEANAVPVAEFTVAQILLANKGFFLSSQAFKNEGYPTARALYENYIGNFGSTIGIIGAGKIGRKVIELLSPYELDIIVFDPFLSDSDAESLGVKKVSLEELFERSNIVSNHLANNEQTKGILTGKLFNSMPKFSTFINTGRGAQVLENELCKVLYVREDITALLDVTDPEPPLENYPFYTLKNCFLTPHIAGSAGNETQRMGQYMVNAYNSFIKNEKISCEVTLKMLETMA